MKTQLQFLNKYLIGGDFHLWWEGFVIALSLRPSSYKTTATLILQLGRYLAMCDFFLVGILVIISMGLVTHFTELLLPFSEEGVFWLLSSIRRARRQNTKVVYSVTEKFLNRYIRLVLWFLSISTANPYRVLAGRIHFLQVHNGPKKTVAYLKECLRLVQHYVAGSPTSTPQKDGEVRVKSRRGLPTIIPGSLRLLIEARDSRTIRAILTILSVFRIIKYPGQLKIETITEPFKGLSDTLPLGEVGMLWGTHFEPLAFSIRKTYLEGKGALKGPLMMKTAGPNYRTAILGAPLDAIAVMTMGSEALRKSMKILSDNFKSDIWNFLNIEFEAVSGWIPKRDLRLGKLSKKLEPAGKIRVFAIADIWTQSVLKPLHDAIFELISKIEQDGTFDQAKPIHLLRERMLEANQTWVASYDLSAATDRLPIALQEQVLSQFFGREIATAWRTILVDRDWQLRLKSPKEDGSLFDNIRYAVGQPMGALSSWGMLALTHHFIVQCAARRLGHKTWFSFYALLGDDIVIADKAVANSYHYLMTEVLGVDINLSKSLVSDNGVMEFAKRLISLQEEFTPLGAKNISEVLKNPAYLPSLLIDFIGKGGEIDWMWVFDKFKQLLDQRDLLRVSKSGLESLTFTVLQPFGFVSYPGLTSPSAMVDSQGEEVYDSYLLLEAMTQALVELKFNEQDAALEKSMENLQKLERFIQVWETRQQLLPPPSFQFILISSRERIHEVMQVVSRSEVPYVDPRGKSLGEILRTLFIEFESISPIDNVLNRPKIVKPRIRRLNLDFFKRVQQYAEALGNM